MDATLTPASRAETCDPANGPSDELKLLKRQFLVSLNHEIRTPLSGILGMTDLLLETQLDDEQHQYVTATRRCAEDLLEVINATLEYSALVAGSLSLDESEFHLPECLRAVVQENALKAEARNLRLVCTLADDLPEVAAGDALRLRQVLFQLIGNAIKFTHSGEVELSAVSGPVEGDRFELWISVSDTGIGIPPEQLGLIFDSFRQGDSGLARGYPGLGLGLALAQALAALMGGKISASSEVGEGSTFEFTVPLGIQRTSPAARVGHASSNGHKRHRILVVEDNDVAQRVVRHILGHGPYEVECVSGGAEAIAAAAGKQYELILMDLQMPGMDGLEATAAIRRLANYADVPVLALTANSSDEYRMLCRERGMQAFLPKPVQSEELLSTVGRFLS